MNIRFAELTKAMISQLDQNSVIANNLANVNSNGFKRDVMFSELLSSGKGADAQTKVSTDFSQGSLTPTDNPLDMAISGEGFFTIDDGDQLAFTRDGHFNRGADGILKTSSGLPVMGQGGWIDLGLGTDTAGEVSISLNGDVFVDDEFIDKLEISSFSNPADLQKLGGNLYHVNKGTFENRVEEPNILQGKIEGSNVEAVHEMVGLIELQRSFETSQKVLQTLDAALTKAATSIGNYK